MRIKNIEASARHDGTGVYIITVARDDNVTAAQEVHEAGRLLADGKEVECKFHRVKRSLDANAYCWVLINKLSAKLNIPPNEIYREAIKDVGDNNYCVPIKNEAIDDYIRVWQGHGIGWIAETMGECKTDGYSYVVTYYGSSIYDSAQMSRLIDIIVTECKEQNIETKTPDEIEKLKGLWGQEDA